MENAVRAAIRFAEEYGFNRWAAAQDQLNDLLETLKSIAEPDVLVNSSKGAFALQALEYKRQQASAALDRFENERDDETA